MIVDNFAEIRSLMKFETPNDFYFVQIMQRKKDGNQGVIDSAHNQYRVIKSYYIRSFADFDRRVPKIKELCIDNNARCYININRRDSVDVCWEAINTYMDLIRNSRTYQGYAVFDHACGVAKSKDKMWMVDVDSKDENYLNKVKEIINQCRGKNLDHIIKVIPSKAGYHLITEKFDSKQFKQLCLIEQIDYPAIHEQGIVLMYFNDLSSNQ